MFKIEPSPSQLLVQRLSVFQKRNSELKVGSLLTKREVRAAFFFRISVTQWDFNDKIVEITIDQP